MWPSPRIAEKEGTALPLWRSLSLMTLPSKAPALPPPQEKTYLPLYKLIFEIVIISHTHTLEALYKLDRQLTDFRNSFSRFWEGFYNRTQRTLKNVQPFSWCEPRSSRMQSIFSESSMICLENSHCSFNKSNAKPRPISRLFFPAHERIYLRLLRVLIGGNPCAHIRQLQADTQSIYFSPHLGSIWSLCVSLYYWSPVVKADGSSVNFTQVPFKPQWRWPTLIWTFNQADDHRAFGLSSKCSFLD